MKKTWKKWVLVISCMIALATGGSQSVSKRKIPPVDLVIHGHWMNR